MANSFKSMVLGKAGKKRINLFKRSKRGGWSSKRDDNWLKRVGRRAKVF